MGRKSAAADRAEPLGRLVRFEATDGVHLSGLLFEPKRSSDRAAIWLHGTGGSSIFESKRTNILGDAFTARDPAQVHATVIGLERAPAPFDLSPLAAHLRAALSPPWTTDWITERGRERLHEYGIAPPGASATAECPQCGSTDTEEVSRFGATPCKAQWRCNGCLEPFERFKCH